MPRNWRPESSIAMRHEVKRHRQLIDDWLARGDIGADEEVPAAMRHNGDDWPEGRGINPEHEVNRPDRDGDGLSDKWEQINKRDPADGRLVFEFDCGGWQTEGWESSGIPDNIAGFQGYLGFALGESGSRLVRTGLKARVMDVDQYLVIRIRAEGDIEVQAIANGRVLGRPKLVTSVKEFARVEIPLKGNAAWNGTIESLAITLTGNVGTEVEIDSITVERTR